MHDSDSGSSASRCSMTTSVPGGCDSLGAMRRRVAASLVLAATLLGACSEGDPTGVETLSTLDAVPAVASMGIDVIEALPHDPGAFTQGLVLDGEVLYESIGGYGSSALMELTRPEVVPEGVPEGVPDSSYTVARRVPVDEEYFAEGLALVDDRLIQLTWKEETAFVYDIESLEVVDEYSYDGQGWGMCFQADEERLVMSDGSNTLTFRDPDTFEETGSVDVTLDGDSLTSLNELECVGGTVYANVWKSDHIAVIDPTDGAVTATIDASDLVAENTGGDVLNGIAYDEATDTFLITGKLWPTMYRVRFLAPDATGPL